MASIIVTNDNNEVDEYEFGPEQLVITIGRRSSNEVCLTDLSVSGRHARIARDNDGTWVEDLNSTNGTYINGRLISRQRLHNGDELMLGKIRLTWLLDEARSADSETARQRHVFESENTDARDDQDAIVSPQVAVASSAALAVSAAAESRSVTAAGDLTTEEFDPEEEAAVAAATAASAGIPEFASTTIARTAHPDGGDDGETPAKSRDAGATAGNPDNGDRQRVEDEADLSEEELAFRREYALDEAAPELMTRSTQKAEPVDDPLDASEEEEREIREAARLFDEPPSSAPELSANLTLQNPEYLDHDDTAGLDENDGAQLSLTARARLALGRVASMPVENGQDAAPTAAALGAAEGPNATEQTPDDNIDRTRPAEPLPGGADTSVASAPVTTSAGEDALTTLHRSSAATVGNTIGSETKTVGFAGEDIQQPTHELDKPRAASRGAVIEIKNGAKSGQILPIDKPVTTLGRPGIQIAAIMRKPDGYFLMHIESDDSVTRPTLNHDAIGDEPVLLHSGDELNVAGIDVEFMLS